MSTNKNTFITAGLVLALIVFIGYRVVSGMEESLPSIEQLVQERRASLMAEQMEIDRDNLKSLSTCRDMQEKAEKASEALDKINICYNKFKREDIDIESEMQKFSSGTVASASSGVPERKVNLRSIFNLGDCRFTNDNHKMPKQGLSWLAYDIACERGKVFNVYAPKYKGEWTISNVSYGSSLGNYVILRQGDVRIVYGHTTTLLKEGDTVTSGDKVGETNISGESTGIHLHLEIWKGNYIVSREFFWADTYESQDQTRLLAHRNWNFGNKYYFTRYDLGDPSQNDSTPCIGASGKDLCELERKGIRTMALTSDIRKLMNIKFGDTVTLVGDKGCSGTYQVHDEMNKRFRQTPGIKRAGTPYYIKGDIPSKEGGACYIIKT